MSAQHAGLNREFIEQQQQRLLALRSQLLGGERKTLADERQFLQQHGDEAEEFEEKAQDMAQMEVEQAVQDVDVGRIARVERALQKIKDGSYGMSDLSGQPIPKARLESTPEAILTVKEERGQDANQ